MEVARPGGDWLVVFAKQPAPGASKTRIARRLGARAAFELAEAFVLDTLENALGLDGVRVLVAYSPASAREWFAQRAPGADLFPQPDLEFGARMRAAMDEAFERGAARCVLIGMDSPHLEPTRLRAAFDALANGDVCLGRSEDGGYYLIGLREPAPRLFDEMEWSTSTVHAATLARAAEGGLEVLPLDEELDVDEADDLGRLGALLRARPSVGKRSRAALERLGLGEA